MASLHTVGVGSRAAFIRSRVRDLSARMGLTKIEVMEEALRALDVAVSVEPKSRLVREGKLLVLSSHDGRPVTLEQTNAAIEAIRNGERD